MLHDLMNTKYLNNSVSAYINFITLFLVLLVCIWIIKSVLLKKFKAWAEKTSNKIDDFIYHAVRKNLLPLLYLGAFYLSIQYLDVFEPVEKLIDIASFILFAVFGVRFTVEIILFSLESYWLKKEEDESKKDAIKGLLTVIKIVVWSTAVIILMDNLGIKISALVAGLGIGGVAIALAAQAILGDLFSYFTIFFDRPFEIGDFIITGEFLGVVEHIGIKTTRIRSLSGEQLIFSNTDLTNSRLRNYKRMERRRVAFRIGVTYQTKLDKLEEIPPVIKDIITAIPDTVFDRTHFFSYGDFSLVYEIVYYVMGSDYNKYMDIQQEINFRIKEEFEKRGIEFAYPTQTIYHIKQ
ncbi:MAG: mechanosensitive ion channel family protein [Elusimicrobia bacterium]|nr:mechanosensitive ion channel family protein [Elusimicrobiota bacterium]